MMLEVNKLIVQSKKQIFKAYYGKHLHLVNQYYQAASSMEWWMKKEWFYKINVQIVDFFFSCSLLNCKMNPQFQMLDLFANI